MMKSNTIAVVGAGEAAIPIIEKAREMNLKSIAFGEKDSLARELSDIFIEKSIFDIDGMVQECLKYNVKGVIASSEITTESAAILADILKLPGNDVKNGFACRNKYVMRNRIKSAGSIKQPKFSLYNENLDINYPVVVKATDSCGKKGITLVEDRSHLNNAVEYAKANSSDNSALVEEYLQGGKEYSIECIVNDKHLYIVQYTDKEISGPPHFAEIAHHQPADLTEKQKKDIYTKASIILSTLGINCGMAHLELKIIDNEIFFIEVGARAGGDHIADRLTYLSTNFDYYKAAIECSLGTYEHKEITNRNYSGIYFYCKNNETLMPLFEIASKCSWCVESNISFAELKDVKSNIEAVSEGYFIYCSDYKICIDDIDIYKPVILNKYENSYDMMWNHNKEIGRELSDEELDSGIKKFLENGYVISILENDHIIAFLNLYCNNYDTLEGYICNVYVLEQYRGLGLSKKIVKEAISICKKNNFKGLKLHVAEDNFVAINLYKKLGFEFTGNKKETPEELELEMILCIK